MSTRLLLVLALAVCAALWIRRARGPAPGREAGGAPGRWDPYAVLGLERGASGDDVTRAYREQMKRYHPDRVADLGRELQELAHRKTVDIQRAYAELAGR